MTTRGVIILHVVTQSNPIAPKITVLLSPIKFIRSSRWHLLLLIYHQKYEMNPTNLSIKNNKPSDGPNDTPPTWRTIQLTPKGGISANLARVDYLCQRLVFLWPVQVSYISSVSRHVKRANLRPTLYHTGSLVDRQWTPSPSRSTDLATASGVHREGKWMIKFDGWCSAASPFNTRGATFPLT